MDAFASLIGDISNLMYGSLLIILLIGAGLYFTLTTKFVQIRAFKAMFAAVMEKPDTKGGRIFLPGVDGFHCFPCRYR